MKIICFNQSIQAITVETVLILSLSPTFPPCLSIQNDPIVRCYLWFCSPVFSYIGFIIDCNAVSPLDKIFKASERLGCGQLFFRFSTFPQMDFEAGNQFREDGYFSRVHYVKGIGDENFLFTPR